MTSPFEIENALHPEVLANPYPFYRWLREHAPVHWSAPLNAWLVTRYPDVQAGLRDLRFSARRASVFFETLPPEVVEELHGLRRFFALWMGFSDPPDHGRLRGPWAQTFTPRASQRVASYVHEVVDQALDAAELEGTMEAMATFSRLPALALARLLGLRVEDLESFRRWIGPMADFMARPHAERARRAQVCLYEWMDFFRQTLERRRDEAPLAPLLGGASTAERLTEEELFAAVASFLSGRNEPTVSVIGCGLLALLQHPEAAAQVREHGLDEAGLDELVRYDSPFQLASRVARTDLELAGHPVRQGQRVFFVLGAANRDAAQFLEPDRLVLSRPDNRHLGFGTGVHLCLGAPLARILVREALSTTLRRLPSLRLETQQPDWQPEFGFRALRSLHLAA